MKRLAVAMALLFILAVAAVGCEKKGPLEKAGAELDKAASDMSKAFQDMGK